MTKIKTPVIFALMGVGVALLFVMNIFFGSVHIPAGDVLNELLGKGYNGVTGFVVIQSRLPQAITALLCPLSVTPLQPCH